MARIGWDQPVCAPWPFHTTGRAVFLVAVGIAWKSSQSRAAQNATKIGEGIAEKRAQGKNVFVDSTAERCVTCKVNERVAIKAETTKKAFAHNNVEFVIADWTNPAPHIAALLEERGQAGRLLSIRSG
jgi:thiol:disulfide interchange protein DsbD